MSEQRVWDTFNDNSSSYCSHHAIGLMQIKRRLSRASRSKFTDLLRRTGQAAVVLKNVCASLATNTNDICALMANLGLSSSYCSGWAGLSIWARSVCGANWGQSLIDFACVLIKFGLCFLLFRFFWMARFVSCSNFPHSRTWNWFMPVWLAIGVNFNCNWVIIALRKNWKLWKWLD